MCGREGLCYSYVKGEFQFFLLVEKVEKVERKGVRMVRGNNGEKVLHDEMYKSKYWFNRKYNRTGHVFQQRHKALLCDKDTKISAEEV